jgi:hypothetical protein
MVDLCVNELLVFNIDQWSEKEDAGTEEGQAPKRKDLDEVVGDEGRSECLRRVELDSVTKAGKGKYEMRMLTAIVTIGFSANKMRWNSMTKKLINCSRSSREASRVSLGIL